MALLRITPATAAVALLIPGLLAFIFGVVAENKKPEGPSASPGLVYDQTSNRSTCFYPKDPTLVLGLLSVIFLFITAVMAVVAFYYPYKGKAVSTSILWRNTGLLAFTILSFIVFLMAEALLLWAVILEFHHRKENVHKGQIAQCPTAKTGLMGGAGFLALDATLFFLIALMLTTNVRADHLMVDDVNDKGSYAEVGGYAPREFRSAGTA